MCEGIPTHEEVWQAMNDYWKMWPSGFRIGRAIDDRTEKPFYCIFDDELPTNSFKFRQAVGVIGSAVRRGDQKLVMSSSGNAGGAMAYVNREWSKVTGEAPIDLTVVVPRSCPSVKVKRLEKLGATVIRVESDDYLDAATTAMKMANEQGVRYVSPDNDRYGIAGAATLGMELFTNALLHYEAHKEMIAACRIDGSIPASWRRRASRFNVYCPYVGGGTFAGLIRGWQTAALMAARPEIPDVNFVAVTYSAWGDNEERALRDRRILTSDATDRYLDVFTGDVEEGSPAFAFVGSDYELTRAIGKADIRFAAFVAHELFGKKVEATAAAAIAATCVQPMSEGLNIAIVSGGNVDDAVWRKVITDERRRGPRPHLKSMPFEDYEIEDAVKYVGQASWINPLPAASQLITSEVPNGKPYLDEPSRQALGGPEPMKWSVEGWREMRWLGGFPWVADQFRKLSVPSGISHPLVDDSRASLPGGRRFDLHAHGLD